MYRHTDVSDLIFILLRVSLHFHVSTSISRTGTLTMIHICIFPRNGFHMYVSSIVYATLPDIVSSRKVQNLIILHIGSHRDLNMALYVYRVCSTFLWLGRIRPRNFRHDVSYFVIICIIIPFRKCSSCNPIFIAVRQIGSRIVIIGTLGGGS